MLVIKRDGRKESVKFDKITARIDKLSYGLNTDFVKTIEIAKKVIDGLYDGVSTQELDELAAETAATLTTKHPDFATLAARIAVSNLHKTTSKSFSSTMKRLYTYVNPKTRPPPSTVIIIDYCWNNKCPRSIFIFFYSMMNNCWKVLVSRNMNSICFFY